MHMHTDLSTISILIHIISSVIICLVVFELNEIDGS